METDDPILEVYWRPGCGYCSSMRAVLAEAGVPVEWHDIWDDPAAAAYVRSVAGGNETVPTVRFRDRVMVAPRPRQLVADLARTDPELVRDHRRWPPLRIAQWVTIALLLIMASILSRTGQTTVSWLVDGLAVASYLGYRRVRARTRR